MKRTIAFLLILVMLLSTLLACQPSSTTSSESSNTSTDTSETPSSTDETVDIEKLNSFYKTELNREGMIRELISKGKKYTFSREIFDGLPDENGTKLTDDKYITGKEYEDTLCSVAFVGRKDVEIVLDLGELRSDISDIALSVVHIKEMNAILPRYIDYYVSKDGTDYIKLGTVYRSTTVPDNTNILFDLKLQETIEARYIKAVVKKDALTSIWLYVDEFCVFNYKKDETPAAGPTPEYYVNPALPEVTEDIYWSSSESDYSDVVNLIAGKDYRIISGSVLDNDYQTSYFNTPNTDGKLTNGKYASSAVYTDSGFFHFTSGRSREITFDLDKVSSVSKAKIRFLQDTPTGIKLPSSVYVYGSMDGKGWQLLHEGNPTSSTTSSKIVTYDVDFAKTKARFVKVEISIATHVWLDEIEIYGSKSIDGAKDIVVEDVVVKYPNEYLSSDAMRGAENLMLSYTFKCEAPEVGLNTKEEYLPYVAYIDKDGNIVDTFFDSFLFLPCMTVCPSGGRLYYNTENPANLSDWLAFEEDLFFEDNNVNGLQLAVEEVDKALGTETTMPIYFSIFSTVFGDKSFGDIDDDGKNEDFSNIEDRKKVIKWWIDRLIARYEAGEYGNLRLDGFYWYHEAIETSDPHERELLKYTADYLHSLGYLFIWIPYYQASGFAEWQAYGFDAVCMQPNYMFHETATESRVYDNAELTKQLGMGVEIEISGAALTDPEYLARYRAYLRVGVETGYMNSIKMYYQDGGPGVFYNACKSTDPNARSVYDDTYLYAKGLLTLESPEIKNDSFEVNKDGKVEINIESKDGSALNVTLNVSPKYGTVKDLGSNKFEYCPLPGYEGEDKFSINIGSSVASGSIDIKVNVKP